MKAHTKTASEELPYNESIRKRLRRKFIEENLEAAERSPEWAAARWREIRLITALPMSQAVDHVLDVIRRIKSDGILYKPGTLFDRHLLRDVRSFDESRKKRRRPRGGLPGPCEIELPNPERDGLPWEQDETDVCLEDILDGRSSYIQLGLQTKRRAGAVERHFETFLYNEQLIDALAYEPGPLRRNRSGERWKPNEMRIATVHKQKSIGTRATAKLLMRTEEEVRDFQCQ